MENLIIAIKQFAPAAAFKARAKYYAPDKESAGGIRISYWGYNCTFIKEVWLKRWPAIEPQEFILHDPNASAFFVCSANKAEVILADDAAQARAAFKAAFPQTTIKTVRRISGEPTSRGEAAAE